MNSDKWSYLPKVTANSQEWGQVSNLDSPSLQASLLTPMPSLPKCGQVTTVTKEKEQHSTTETL